MPDKQDPKHGDPHPDGDGTFWSRAARLFVVPAEEVAHENGTVAQPSAANKPAAADVSTTVVAPAIPGGVAIDQGKYDNAVAAVTKKYPGLVILNQAWQESEGEGFSEQQRVRLALKRLSSNGIGVMPLLDQFTHAVSDVEQQEQLVLKESEELLDSKVGTLRRLAEASDLAVQQLQAQITEIQVQIAQRQQQQADIIAQADEAERVHTESEAVKLATVAATKLHFSALKDMVQRNKGV